MVRGGRTLWSMVGLVAMAAGCSEPGTGPTDTGATTDAGTTSFTDAGRIVATPVDSGLPDLPTIDNVTATIAGDSVTIRFQPVDGARDYRVYELPDPSRIEVFSDGSVTVRDATYRCAGDRVTTRTIAEGEEDTVGSWVHTVVDGTVGGVPRTMADATLGYVYVTAGEGRIPVYALGDSAPHAESRCGSGWFSTTRSKIYTTSDSERARLLALGWRDDGVAFYAPTSGESVAFAELDAGSLENQRLYFRASSAEASERTGAASAFSVFAAETPGTHALMRVNVSTCSDFHYPTHDELVVGETYFERARFQGDEQPETVIQWSGLTAGTTLVVEALDTGCPFQARLGPVHIDERTEDYPEGPWLHSPTVTIDELRATIPTGEVFVNGQHDVDSHPRAVARSYLEVAPAAHETMDWYEDFAPGTSMAPFTERHCSVPDGNCFQMFEATSEDYTVLWHTIETDSYGLAPVMGELWVSFTDWAADTNGKFRIEPTTRGRVEAGSYFHVTMEATTVSTGRRYPQLIISDRPAPLHFYMPEGNTIVLQPRWHSPNLALQVCDHRTWDVNNQCPGYVMNDYRDDADTVIATAPVLPPVEHFGADHRTRYDLFLSATRAYVFLDQQPFGCVDLPASGIPVGDVGVAFGSVLYHSEADSPLGYIARAYPRETQVHYDNLGFSSGVAAPAWDESRFPCIAPDDVRTDL